MEKRSISALDSRISDHNCNTSAIKPKTAKQIRTKYKMNLLQYFQEDNNKRRLEKELISHKEKQKKESHILDKLSREKQSRASKSAHQKERFNLIQREYDDHMKALNEKHNKTARMSPESRNNSFTKWREKSKSKLEKIKQEEENYLLLKMELYNKKIEQSSILHKKALDKKTKSIFKHNLKVEEVKNNLFKGFKYNGEALVLDYLTRFQSATNKREKRQAEISSRTENKRRSLAEKKQKCDQFRQEEMKSLSKRAEDYEKKNVKSLDLIRAKKMNWENKLDMKHEKNKLKIEETNEKMTRSRYEEFRIKENIIKKHLELDNRLKMRKNTQERINEKMRDFSMKETIERDKAKLVKLKIHKSREPVNFKSIMSDYI